MLQLHQEGYNYEMVQGPMAASAKIHLTRREDGSIDFEIVEGAVSGMSGGPGPVRYFRMTEVDARGLRLVNLLGASAKPPPGVCG